MGAPKRIPTRIIGKAFLNWEHVIKESFNWELLYKNLYFFLQEEKWQDLQRGGDDFETYYLEQDLGGGVKSQDIWWRAFRKPKKPLSGNYRYYLKLDFKTLAIKKKEVMIEGKKTELDSGELTIKCWLYIDTQAKEDWTKQWDNHFILKLFKRWFWKRAHRDEYEFAKEELAKFSADLQEFLHTYTGARPEDTSKGWVRPKGVTN